MPTHEYLKLSCETTINKKFDVLTFGLAFKKFGLSTYNISCSYVVETDPGVGPGVVTLSVGPGVKQSLLLIDKSRPYVGGSWCRPFSLSDPGVDHMSTPWYRPW